MNELSHKATDVEPQHIRNLTDLRLEVHRLESYYTRRRSALVARAEELVRVIFAGTENGAALGPEIDQDAALLERLREAAQTHKAAAPAKAVKRQRRFGAIPRGMSARFKPTAAPPALSKATVESIRAYAIEQWNAKSAHGGHRHIRTNDIAALANITAAQAAAYMDKDPLFQQVGFGGWYKIRS